MLVYELICKNLEQQQNLRRSGWRIPKIRSLPPPEGLLQEPHGYQSRGDPVGDYTEPCQSVLGISERIRTLVEEEVDISSMFTLFYFKVLYVSYGQQ